MRQASFESCEARRLLAYAPVGAPVTAQAGNVIAVEAADSINNDVFSKHIAAWTSGGDVNVRVFSSNGSPFGNVITVDNGGNPASSPDVGFDIDEGFIVVWQGVDSDGSGIFGQYFDAGGAPISGAFKVNTTETGAQTSPRVGIADDGTFIVVWESDPDGPGPAISEIYGQRFLIGGAPSGTEFVVSDGAVATHPDIATSGPGGQSVVVWQSGTAIKAQRLSNAGAKVGGVINVTNSGTSSPSVGMADDGDFVVAFSDVSGPLGVVKARRYNGDGTAVAGAFTVAATAVADQRAAVVDVADDGRFVVGWTEPAGGGGPSTVLAFRAFKSNGLFDGSDNRITGVKFGGENRFGLTAQETDLIRIGYAATVTPDGGSPSDDALIQTFNRVPGVLEVSADNNGSVIQIYGSASNVRTVVDGVSTNWGPPSDFTGIIVHGGDGADYIRAKNISLPMTVYGGAGDDTITTGDGDDYVDGGLGNDAINTQGGNDYAYGADETDTIFGGSGDDTLTGGPGRNELWGEDGDDLLNGSNRPDILYGGPGNDHLRGFAGGDALFGGTGSDHLEGGNGNDALWGQDGDDYIEGGRGDDKLVGGRGDDTLLGQQNVDTLYGNLGRDILNGGLEGDTGYYDPDDILISVEILRLVF